MLISRPSAEETVVIDVSLTIPKARKVAFSRGGQSIDVVDLPYICMERPCRDSNSLLVPSG
jgi:hypothetical protein